MEYKCIIFSCLLLQICSTLDQASFYGNSFISLPFKEAKSSTDISFKFRTNLPDTLILLVAGSTDYCIVKLENSRIKVIINLGAGETEVTSPQNAKFSDFKWHEVVIERREANLSVSVDKTHKVQKHLPGKFFELNIHYGLFIGDHKSRNNSDMFFGHVGKFRGCLSELKYNGVTVLEQARQRQSQATVQGVTWNCAAEFEANVDRPISFVEDDAFVVIPQKIQNKEIKITFELKTIAQDGLLFYNTGKSTKQEYFSLELANRSVRATMKIHEKSVEVYSLEEVSDGEWHKVVFRSTPSTVELIVDEKKFSESNTLRHNFQFTDSSYLGGMEVNKRYRASSKGCRKCDISFKGCIRNFKSMDVRKGLPDAHVTEGILPGCIWNYPCLHNPCNDNGTCVQQGLDSFQCHCKEDLCVKVNYTEGYKVFSKNSLATELELLAVEPLEVVEGENQIITTNNLHMILDYQKYGIKDTGINFFIVEGPEHGSVTIDIWPHEKSAFSLSDIGRDKVYYVHDGSEHTHDSMVLEVEFSPADTFILPVYLQGKFRFSLLATILLKNDPPTLEINDSTVLRVVQGTKKLITGDVLNALDPDNTASQLVFNILKSETGYFENLRKPGAKITSFTQEDVDKEKIMYFDKSSSGVNDSYISLQISDGIETSKIYKVRVSIAPQYWRLENNTGLVVLHQTSSVITPQNLSFTSNVGNVDYRAQFSIVKKPHYGVIEVEKYGNSWEISDVFSSNDLKQHRVRYKHTNSKPDFDEFQFKTSFDKSSIYTFRLTFAKCTLQKINSNSISLNDLWETAVTTNHLSFETHPLKTLTSIDYVIVKPPIYGFLFSALSKYRLRSCDMFKQEDLASQNIKYKLHQRGYSVIEDNFTFVVLSPGCNNVTGNITIKYFPSNDLKSKVKVNLRTLNVEEGSTSLIDSSHLHLKTDFLKEIFFNVTEKPKHGYLLVKKGELVKNNTDFFTIQEITSNMLYYVHDNSETIKDHFKFLALSPNEQSFEFVETLHINVELRNDNSPTRAVDKVFHIVVGGERVVTGNDLRYTDLDLGTLSSSISYTCRESPNGDFYNIKNQSTKITEFTQEDLDNNKIVFKHKGPEYGKVKLTINDGKFYVNGILEIQASAPFIHAVLTKKIIVEQNKFAVITNEQLQYSTNLYASDSDVFYEVVTRPHSGKIILTKSLKGLDNFTQEDINMGRVSYLNEHSKNNENADEIYIRVRCKDAVNVAQLGVWILPSIYWEPLQVKNAKKLSVEESTSALITKKILEVTQNNVPASSIVYHINEMPDHGYITILSDVKNSHEPINVVSFSQDMVNENKILYIQSGSNQTKDRITFNVTNGIVWHNNIRITIEIIPEKIYMATTNLVVQEGGVSVITNSHIYVLTDYYKSKITSYMISKGPQFGCVQVHKHCIKTNLFAQKELTAGVIKYQHQGSENHEDEIEIIAKSDQKKSVPVVLKINVVPLNNQKPKLINNTGLTMWEGGVAVITNKMLGAIDEDKPPETLKYHVQTCWWGVVSLLSESSSTINYFTQDLLNKGMVVFKHQNGTEGRFKFNISDGVHTTKDYMFLIKTKPVQVKLTSNALHIFPLQRKYISATNLYTFISDPEREAHYEITTPPSLGRLMMDTGGVIKVVSAFTQEDLNNSRVYYEHTHQFSDLYANDSFVFNVKAHLAPKLLNRVFKIDISVSSGGLDAYVNIPKIALDEGAMTNIILNLSGVVTFLESHAGLRAPIIHAAASQPQHGQVFLQNNQSFTTFTQQQLESGQVYYEHDHSDSLGDNLHFSLYLLPGYVILCNITVPVIINPINDQPFHLITPAPSLTVVQGENHTITRKELATEDADTPPAKLKYILISAPSHGKLVLLPDREPTMYFTQADIDDNRLIYMHEGSVLKDSFHFRVWDEKFRPEFTLFNIMVIPINITITPGLPVLIQQGSDVVFLSENQFFIETNADKHKVRYTIKVPPKHGVLYVKDNPVTSFTHEDIRDVSVMYLQTDMTTANDTFKVFGEIKSGDASYGNEIEVFMKVQPLMQIHNFTVLAGELNKLTLNVLDATPLTKLTLNSNSRYTVLNLPQYGQIRKIIRSSGEKTNILDTAVSSFSHEDIQSGLIYLQVKDVEIPWNGLQDRLVFMLAASIFQPAIGELKIFIRSSLDNEIYSTLAGPSDPAGHEGGLHLASPNMTRDYLLIVSMVVGVIVLGIAVIIIIKCRSLEVEELNKEEQCMQPIPLPRPPDRLMSSSPPLKQHMDGFSTPLSTALPQCKVTPLSRSDLDSNVCYPYGVEENPDDWSSCDASEPPCPSKNIMLRRNQYWV
ncbi:unnamed protein product [Brassicogethes aeneus]|uniref:Chondroitin sulfate proteoglycan 4 n=1 Tax=Brassicogethes aeneus TaxID=1431903 RepID=A0A9P0FNT8_BRAAE|nr:unnamed protein product [Brassicogethes aeneus]